MKIRFLILNLFFGFTTWSTLFGYTIPDDYIHIECTIKPFVRKSKKLSQSHQPKEGKQGKKGNQAKLCQPNQKLEIQNKKLSRSVEQLNTISHPNIPGPKVTRVGTQKAQETSTNWSGYVAATNFNNPARGSVTGAYGSWIVPSIIPSGRNTYSAIWVGIDGYNSPTVEQIGTAHDYVNGVRYHYAWFEMYPRASYTIQGFPIKVGDVISGIVEYVGNDTFILQIINNTQRIATTIPTRYTKMSGTQRKNAEWIFEAPSSNRVLPLTNVQRAYLSNCMAKINGIKRPLNSPFFANNSIEMVTNNGTSKAIPSAISSGGSSFSVTWLHE